MKLHIIFLIFSLTIFNSYSSDIQNLQNQIKVLFYASEDHHYKDIEPEIFYLNKKCINQEDCITALAEIPELIGKDFFIKECEENEANSIILISKNTQE